MCEYVCMCVLAYTIWQCTFSLHVRHVEAKIGLKSCRQQFVQFAVFLLYFCFILVIFGLVWSTCLCKCCNYCHRDLQTDETLRVIFKQMEMNECISLEMCSEMAASSNLTSINIVSYERWLWVFPYSIRVQTTKWFKPYDSNES